jgi:hypothetical protein
MTSFTLDFEQELKLRKFKQEHLNRVGEMQLNDPTFKSEVHQNEDGTVVPYLGAIGGGFTYEFTPTGLGEVCKVYFCKDMPKYEAVIDLTDYESW